MKNINKIIVEGNRQDQMGRIIFDVKQSKKAMKLNGSALKLYLYFYSMSYRENHFFLCVFCELTGMSMTGVKKAFQELRDKGFLKEVGEREYQFIWRENQ